MKPLEIRVSREDAGADVLGLLSALLINESKARLRRLVATGHIRVNGKAVVTTARLSAGDIVSLPPRLDTGPPRPASLRIELLHEDEDHVVVNKPAGHTVLPDRSGRREFYDALVAALNRETPPDGPYVRPHIVHRLDRETSGVLLVAKSEDAARALSLQFQRRQVRKCYLAIVEGVLPRAELTVSIPLRRSASGGLKMVTNEKSGKPAVTDVELKETFGHFSLLEARPLTGRQHQIRVHLAAIGYPLAADLLYGRRKGLTGAEFNRIVRADKVRPERMLLGRCPLHALSIAYRHPTSLRGMEWTAPVPADLAGFLRLLRRVDLPADERR